ncbi:MAG: Crp/Fnr family transcriptional regulator [Sphaerochaetaceae bacterium]|jgi:CRP-like cAMP-binding protein|nr:Crp/Fnr family transcriptional regulator [Sphaerochaetaceae bacterium]MDX9808742.1 Crp/Fnr family transcriptional regulator [Sphaerochaetaceae bacterium]NLV83064.1 Crp/Fnr family transcriptional regulator [Spirochaetales bacterium]
MEERIRTVPEGSLIYEQGKDGDTLSYIVSGRVGLFLQYGEPEQFALDEMGPGESFGEMGMLNGIKRSVTAVALIDSEVIEISFSELEDFVTTHPDVTVRMLKAMSRRLLGATNEIVNAHHTIRELIEELGDRPVRKEGLKERLKRYASFFVEVPGDIPPEVYMDYYSRIDRL